MKLPVFSFLVFAIFGLPLSVVADIPNAIPHQGRVSVNGVNFDGPGQFKFLLFTDVDANHASGNETALWSNTTSTPAGLSEPAAALSLPVTQGHYSLFLGDPSVTTMAALPASIEPGSGELLYLRTWFDDGVNGSEQLTPDQAIGSTPFALHARNVTVGGVTSAALADGSVTTAKLADMAVTAPKIEPGAVSQLGTPDGTVPDALQMTNDGFAGLGTTDPEAALHVSGGADIFAPSVSAVITDGSNGVTDLTDPGTPAIDGTLMAVPSFTDNAVSLFDVSDSENPSLQAIFKDGQLLNGHTYDRVNSPRGVVLSGNLLAFTAENAVTLVDVTTPSSPVHLQTIGDGDTVGSGFYGSLAGASALALQNDLLVVAGRTDNALTLIDVSTPGTPLLRETIIDGQTTNGHLYTFLNSINYLALDGGLLVVAADFNDVKFTLIDVSMPSLPVFRQLLRATGPVNGHTYVFTFADGIDLENDLLAIHGLGDTVPQLTVTDVTDPVNPVHQITIEQGDTVNGHTYDELENSGGIGAAWNGSRLALGNNTTELVFFMDFSSPQSPTHLATVRNGAGMLHSILRPSGLAWNGDLLAVTGLDLDNVTLFSTALAPEGGVFVRERMGIGTDAPQADLHVRGDFLLEGAKSAFLDADRVTLGPDSRATGFGSIAGGFFAEATGEAAISLGRFTDATGLASAAFGSSTEASGNSATAFGGNTEASGDHATAFGRSTIASGNRATALGDDTESSGSAATAFGLSTVASGSLATAFGEGTVAPSSHEVAPPSSPRQSGAGRGRAEKRIPISSISLRSVIARVHFPGQALLFGDKSQKPRKAHLLHRLGGGSVQLPGHVIPLRVGVDSELDRFVAF